MALVSQTSIGSLLAPLPWPLAGSLIMYVIVRWIESLLPGGVAAWTALLWLVTTGVIFYLAYTLICLRPVALELVGLAWRG